jgi:hypothetical protein
MRKKLNESEKKSRMTVTINPIVAEKVNSTYNNVSKHVEWLLYQDLRKNNKIDEIPL